MTQTPTSPAVEAATLPDTVAKALRTAFSLGQTYWQQADSEYASQHRKADETSAKFRQLVADTVLPLTSQQEVAAPVGDDEVKSICKAAGVEYLMPDDDEGFGYPGGFDMTSLDDMRKIIAASRVPVASVSEPMRLDAFKANDVAEILIQAGWKAATDAQWERLEAALPALQATLTHPTPEQARAGAGGSVGAMKLLREIRFHPRRHELPRDWLTKADEVLGTFASPSPLGRETGSSDHLAEGAGDRVHEWQPIKTAPQDIGKPLLLMWVGRGPSSGCWDLDDEFDARPKGWVSPEYGWRGHQDMCIPRNQEMCTHWMPLPAAPTNQINPVSDSREDGNE